MESAMILSARAATRPLRGSSSQAFVGGASLLHLRCPGRAAIGRRSSSSHTAITTTNAALTALPLPSEYGYVILTATAASFLVQWQAFQVGRQRRKAGVLYPKMYEDAEPSVFNCYQRAHLNTLEAYPSFLALLAIGGLGYPLTSSAFGVLWCVGRVVYSLGYYTGDPDKRLIGMFHFFGLLGLFFTCIVLGVRQAGLLSLIGS